MVNLRLLSGNESFDEGIKLIDFPRTVTTNELMSIFTEFGDRRNLQISGNLYSNQGFGVYKGWPLYTNLTGLSGLISCNDPMGALIFDTKIERIALSKNNIKYEIGGLKFFVVGEEEIKINKALTRQYLIQLGIPLNDGVATRIIDEESVVGNPELARILTEDITRYFAEHSSPQG